MLWIDSADLISISEASRMGVSALVRRAEEGNAQIVHRNNKPVAVILGIKDFEELNQLADDLSDITLVTARMLTTGLNRYSLDEVLERFGVSREQRRDPSN